MTLNRILVTNEQNYMAIMGMVVKHQPHFVKYTIFKLFGSTDFGRRI